MATSTNAALLARLNVWLEDSDNFAFTLAAKTEGLNAVITDDPNVYVVVIDTSKTITANTPSYTLDAQYEAVYRVSVDVAGDSYGTPLDDSAWTYNNTTGAGGTLRFKQAYKGLPVGKTLMITAKKRLISTDVIPDYLQGYILHRACSNMLGQLKNRKTGRFLRNDATMGDLVANQQDHDMKAEKLARKLSNRRDFIL